MKIAPDGTAYDVTGPGHAPVLVFIHGMGLCSAVWDEMLPEFQGYRIIRYDLYGHGQSAPAPKDMSLTTLAKQAVGLLDHLEITAATFIGFSIGGMINRRIAMDFPERVQQLVILNSPHDRGPAEQVAVEARAKQTQRDGPGATVDAAVARWFTPECLASGHDAPKRAREWVIATDHQSYAQTAWVLANGVVELTHHDPPITHPTLVITSENDERSTPAMSRAIAAEIDGAELHIIPDLKHMGLVEDPAAFARPIRAFLSDPIA